MSEVNVNVWGLCPFRSPVETPGPANVVQLGGPSAPRQSLGPCLYLGCGMWKVTKVDAQGKPVDGMCSFRYTAECLEQVAGALQRLTSIAIKMTGGAGAGEIPTSLKPLS